MHAETWLPRSAMAKTVLLASIAFFRRMIWWPISQTFALSLQLKKPGQQHWIGLANYHTLFQDPVFYKALSVTFGYGAMTVPGVVLLGLALAVTLNGLRNVTVRGFFTSLYFVPYVVPLVAVALVWRYMYLPGNQGLFNVILDFFDLGPIRWLNSQEWALRSLALLRIWKTAGYAMVLFLAGLQSIPAVFYEAASIDGANAWQSFRYVTLPLIQPVLLVVVLFSLVWTIADFQLPYVLTGGGPANSTHLFGTLAYSVALGGGSLGQGAAISLFMFPFLLATVAGLLGYMRRQEA